MRDEGGGGEAHLEGRSRRGGDGEGGARRRRRVGLRGAEAGEARGAVGGEGAARDVGSGDARDMSRRARVSCARARRAFSPLGFLGVVVGSS